MATKPSRPAAPAEQTEPSIKSDSDLAIAPETAVQSLASVEFARGVRAGAEAMRFYFLNEDEAPIYDVSANELESFEKSAVEDSLRDEGYRIKRDGI
ncbi:hypothetical protein [Cryobacterium zhongshanensis]|uniref:Uncharacterized protein n=1 Tax=Cryobacterium zhongshanensis TaxID=2928153 RepID=A0AA41UGD2_9MICO|nr:hypothetical protein [Cryobacterium zhongshanensis]MCI4659603.1 hypothetical protein [Cryobacterium zhongshanensis]